MATALRMTSSSRLRTTTMIRYLLLLAIIAPLAHGDDLSADPAVREMFWQLLAQSHYGFGHEEGAAFVVRGEIGGYRCVAWPSDGAVDSGRWEGRFPDGVVAIIHTHPNWRPMPSSIDARTARRTRIPVYVITRKKITLTNGRENQVAIAGEWKPELTPRPCSPVALGVARSGRLRNSFAADFHHQVEFGY